MANATPAVSPLRRRMIDDTTVRNLSSATQRSYLHAVAKFSQYFDRSPDLRSLTTIHGPTTRLFGAIHQSVRLRRCHPRQTPDPLSP